MNVVGEIHTYFHDFVHEKISKTIQKVILNQKKLG